MKIDGRCHCGRITFTAEVDPARVSVCHCADCQVLSGSPFRVSVPAPIEHFSLHGEPKRYVKVAQSGNHRVQAFCPDCGTPLFACATDGATQVMIRTGCVAQRAELAPREQIWTASAQSWVSGVHALPDAGRR